jgi:hypothetical protein
MWLLLLLIQDVWVADPMDKVFQDAEPGSKTKIEIQTARNEFESAQIVVRGPAKGVSVEFGTLTSADGTKLDATWRYDGVGYVPVKGNIDHTNARELVRKAPADFPDPLLEERTLDVPPDRAQPIWLTLFTPKEAAPGKYSGSIKAAGKEIAVDVEVWPITLPDERHLLYSNWFWASHFAKQFDVPVYSDAFYEKLRPYLKQIAAHRQNIVWVEAGTVKTIREPDGAYRFDYADFDRFINEITPFGLAERIEISQLGVVTRGQFGEAMDFIGLQVLDRKSGKTQPVKDREVLGRWLEALQAHLKEKGWLEKALLHVVDEPFPNHRRAYTEMCGFVRQHAPAVKLIDAVITPNLDTTLDVYVPQLALFDHWRPEFEKARAKGAEFWFYTCCVPTGQFANRFIQNSLVQTRILQWINRRYHMPGYLHWGLNYWQPNDWPAGDPNIIYPGKDGPVSSIRWEAVRDGIEDYEYFWLLDQAMAVLKKKLGCGAESLDSGWMGDVISGLGAKSGSEYVRDPEALRGLRRKIVEAVLETQSGTPVMLETSPAPTEPVNVGFPLIAVKGCTVPGAKILINGHKFTTGPDGRFDGATYISPSRPIVTVKVVMGETTTVRNFSFRMVPSRDY